MVSLFMNNLEVVITFPSIFINISTKIRFLTIYGFLDKKDIYDYYHDQIRDYIDNDITNNIIPYIEKYKTVKKYNPYFPFITNSEKDKSYKLVVRSVEDSNRISFEYLSVYDLSKRISNWGNYIIDLEYDSWKKPNNDTSITDTSLKIHDFHARDIDKIAGTINFEMSDSYLSIYDTSCKKNNILFRQKYLTRMILYAYFLICICSILPLIIASHNVLTGVDYLDLMYKRPSTVQLIHFFSHESYVGDSESFLPSECEGILKDYLLDLKNNQERIIYSDDYIDLNKIPLLNELHYKKTCKFKDNTKCENETYFPQYGYTKEVVQLPINELIDEYIRKTEAHVTDHEIMNYSIRHRDNIYSLKGKRNDDFNDELEKIREDYFFNSRVLKFQNYTKHHILSGMNRSNEAIIQDLSKGVFTMKIIGIILFAVNIILIIILFYYYYFRILSEKEKEILEIVDILFLLPAPLARIPQIRDFIEFGNIND
ncbi:hypothetical protein PIROE2DRAFT_13054 [Piromyces sp. E2]|nr:hypothetical protein PIROE2DRAFT_13054 [Piromyces sp. E2]|eukprot:OUM61058.1 hypothetical protein PIROE2DRAFT_13054 [Piromyces sp. E2]